MAPTITAFERSPDRGRGLARDMRVRWALEEVGQPHEVRLVSFEALKQPAHLALNPFGQIPTWQDGELTLFESGAIVLHIAERHKGLLPDQPDARARAISWMFAALTTVEPPIVEWSMARIVESAEPWFDQRQPMLVNRVRSRLAALSARLGDAAWLDGAFSAGDLLMVTVLMRLGGSGLVEENANLAAYLARAEGRPAFQRAFAAQLAVYQASAPGRSAPPFAPQGQEGQHRHQHQPQKAGLGLAVLGNVQIRLHRPILSRLPRFPFAAFRANPPSDPPIAETGRPDR